MSIRRMQIAMSRTAKSLCSKCYLVWCNHASAGVSSFPVLWDKHNSSLDLWPAGVYRHVWGFSFSYSCIIALLLSAFPEERPNMQTRGAFIIEVNPLTPGWCGEYHVYTLNDRTLHHDTMGNYTAFQLNDRLASMVLSPVRTSAEVNDDCHLHSNTHARTTRSKSFEP